MKMSLTHQEDYDVREALKEEIVSINSLLESSFHPEETILQCLLRKYKSILTESDLAEIEEDQRAIIAAMISNYPCQVLVQKSTGKIVGANVTIVSENPELVSAENRSVDVYEMHRPRSQFLRDYFRYMNGMIEEARVFSKFQGAKRFLEFYAVTVDGNHRRKGLSTLLMRKAIDFASKSEPGVDVVFGLFTSPFSKRAAAKLGFDSIFDFDLLDYRDADGSLLFEESRGHSAASVMALKI